MTFKKSLFFPPRNKRIAKIISIKSPSAFKISISKLREGGITITEKRSLVLAKNRAKAQLKRKNLSPKERKQFKMIVAMKLPNITLKKR
jgi:hypothetical protein